MSRKLESDHILSSHPKKVTVGQVQDLLKNNDEKTKRELTDLIEHRLLRRYLNPLDHVPKNQKSGFLMMATACLLIETLESFRRGIKDTNKQSSRIFREFFEKENLRFPGFSDEALDFFHNVRCGILHQAETTGGLQIVRKGPLLNANRAINANRFIISLRECIATYIQDLRSSELTSEVWINAKLKLGFICDNCNPE